MSKPFSVIALTGASGSGKDTVADLLHTHADFLKLAFADALRDQICEAYSMEPVYLTHRDTKEHPMTALSLSRCLADGFVGRMVLLHQAAGQPLDMAAPRSPRQIMQWWGTEYRRHQDPDYWVNSLRWRLCRLILSGDFTRFVVTDCRFANEVAMLRAGDIDAQLWQVARPPSHTAGALRGAGAAERHASETDGAEFAPDAIIYNSGDMRHLQQQVLGHWWAHDAGLEGVKVEIAA